MYRLVMTDDGQIFHDARAPRSGLHFDMFCWMDGPSRDAFAKATRRRRVSAGEMIYTQGDDGVEMYRIEHGSVRLSILRRDGREVVLLFLQPGDCFGDSSLVDGEPRPQTARAISDVDLSVLGISAFRELRRDCPDFGDALLRLLATQMRAATAQYADSSLDGLRTRVLSRVILSARSFSAEADCGVRLTLRLSQSELAMMVGASRQHVNKVLKGLEKDGLIGIKYGNIIIRDFAGLIRELNADCR
jgi:CRP/FNR family cyclic AMP-dependent transcriptional regulator